MTGWARVAFVTRSGTRPFPDKVISMARRFRLQNNLQLFSKEAFQVNLLERAVENDFQFSQDFLCVTEVRKRQICFITDRSTARYSRSHCCSQSGEPACFRILYPALSDRGYNSLGKGSKSPPRYFIASSHNDSKKMDPRKLGQAESRRGREIESAVLCSLS